MDIMFSPRGTLTGQLAATQGILHFCISTLEDAERARDLGSHSINQAYSGAPPVAPPGTFPFVLADPATTQRIVSVYLTSGRVSTSDLVTFPGDSNATPQDERAGIAPSYASVYTYALRGKEAK
jgi:hypothetical protein